MPAPTALESRSFKEEKGLLGMRNRRGPEALSFQDLRCDIDRAFVRLEEEVDTLNFGFHYGASATDPVGTIEAGSVYWNTVLDRLMTYDTSRSRWLTIESETLPWGRKGNTAPGSYFRGVDGIAFTSARGYVAQENGVLVAITYTRSDNDLATLEVTANGVAIAELNSSSFSGYVDSLNADITQGQVLGVRNKSGGNSTSDVSGTLVVKWRV